MPTTCKDRRSVVVERDVDVTTRRIAHLHRRAGFGIGGDALERAVAAGFDAELARLTDLRTAEAATPPTLTPIGEVDPKDRRRLRADAVALATWWLGRMVATEQPWREKLTLLWHGHFATSIQKVHVAKLMYDQNALFRTQGGGDFEALTQAVAKDPAMLLWLDSNTNRRGHPNENFARELMELFTLGIGNYGEGDVQEAARAFTGWTLDRSTGEFRFRPRLHDDGSKTVLGRTGAFGGEDVIRQVTTSPACARFVTAKLWSHLAYPVTPDHPVVASLVTEAPLDVGALASRIFRHPEFVSDAAQQGLVKQPIEYVVGVLRAVGVSGAVVEGRGPFLLATLQALGQVPFAPPSVGGWGQNGYWLSSASSLARLRFATVVAATVPVPAVEDASRGDRPDAMAHVLGVEWSSATAIALQSVADDPRALVALAFVAPESVLS